MRSSIIALLAVASSVMAQLPPTGAATYGFNTFTAPTKDFVIPKGEKFKITWDASAQGMEKYKDKKVNIALYGGCGPTDLNPVTSMASGTSAIINGSPIPNDGSYEWDIPAAGGTIGSFSKYGLQIYIVDDTSLLQWSPVFSIAGNGANTATCTTKPPAAETPPTTPVPPPTSNPPTGEDAGVGAHVSEKMGGAAGDILDCEEESHLQEKNVEVAANSQKQHEVYKNNTVAKPTPLTTPSPAPVVAAAEAPVVPAAEAPVVPAAEAPVVPAAEAPVVPAVEAPVVPHAGAPDVVPLVSPKITASGAAQPTKAVTKPDTVPFTGDAMSANIVSAGLAIFAGLAFLFVL